MNAGSFWPRLGWVVAILAVFLIGPGLAARLDGNGDRPAVTAQATQRLASAPEASAGRVRP